MIIIIIVIIIIQLFYAIIVIMRIVFDFLLMFSSCFCLVTKTLLLLTLTYDYFQLTTLFQLFFVLFCFCFLCFPALHTRYVGVDGRRKEEEGNLIKRNQLQQQTDSDKAKPFVLGTDLDSWCGRGWGECDATQLN